MKTHDKSQQNLIEENLKNRKKKKKKGPPAQALPLPNSDFI